MSNPQLVAAVESGSASDHPEALRQRSPLEISVRFIVLRHFWTQLGSVLPLVDFAPLDSPGGEETPTAPSLAQMLVAPHVRACVCLHTKLALWERVLAVSPFPSSSLRVS